MKHMKKFAFLMILAVGLGSCSLFNVSADGEMSTVLDIYVPEDMTKAADGWYDLLEEKEVDARENDDVQEYIDRLDEIVVEDITATVLTVSEEGIVLSPNTVFYMIGATNSVEWSLGKEWPIPKGATFTFDNLGDKYKDASDIIMHAVKNEKESMITFGVVGESSKDNINVQIEIKVLEGFTVSLL